MKFLKTTAAATAIIAGMATSAFADANKYYPLSKVVFDVSNPVNGAPSRVSIFAVANKGYDDENSCRNSVDQITAEIVEKSKIVERETISSEIMEEEFCITGEKYESVKGIITGDPDKVLRAGRTSVDSFETPSAKGVVMVNTPFNLKR